MTSNGRKNTHHTMLTLPYEYWDVILIPFIRGVTQPRLPEFFSSDLDLPTQSLTNPRQPNPILAKFSAISDPNPKTKIFRISNP
jgi:hypothetical protein